MGDEEKVVGFKMEADVSAVASEEAMEAEPPVFTPKPLPIDTDPTKTFLELSAKVYAATLALRDADKSAYSARQEYTRLKAQMDNYLKPNM